MQISDVPSILQRIELCIVESKMPKQEFYRRSGISSGSFSQWNTGTHKPTLKKLQDAADTLGVSLEYLLSGEGSKKAAPEAGDGDLDTSGLSADAIDFAKRVAALSPEKRALLDAYIRALKDI